MAVVHSSLLSVRLKLDRASWWPFVETQSDCAPVSFRPEAAAAVRCGKGVCDLVAGCLNKDPLKRPSASDVCAALEDEVRRVKPTPATDAILTVLKAGESVFNHFY